MRPLVPPQVPSVLTLTVDEGVAEEVVEVVLVELEEVLEEDVVEVVEVVEVEVLDVEVDEVDVLEVEVVVLLLLELDEELVLEVLLELLLELLVGVMVLVLKVVCCATTVETDDDDDDDESAASELEDTEVAEVAETDVESEVAAVVASAEADDDWVDDWVEDCSEEAVEADEADEADAGPVQVPKAGSHPWPQYTSPVPQYPYALQQAPKALPAQVWPSWSFPQPPSVETLLVLADGAVHEPKASWQPAPQKTSLLPHQPWAEQQPPNALPRHVLPPALPQLPSVDMAAAARLAIKRAEGRMMRTIFLGILCLSNLGL